MGRSKNVQGISTAYENIGEIFIAEKKYDEAICISFQIAETDKRAG